MIAAKVRAVCEAIQPPDSGPMLDFGPGSSPAAAKIGWLLPS